MTGTNIIQVMGTNILTMWPHASVVTNLNADMVDGKHAEDIVATATNRMIETDPQVADNIANNYIPRWNSATTQLVSGSIFDNGNVGIGTVTPDGKIDLQAGNGGTAISISANYPESYRWRMIPTDRGNAIDLDFTVSDASDEQERLLQLSHSTSGRPEFALLNNQLVVNNGNVGIGTVGPNAKLHIFDSAAAYAVKDILIGSTISGYPDDVAKIQVQRYSSLGQGWNFIVNTDGAGTQTEAMRINSEGNVGIGTAGPAQALEISRGENIPQLRISNNRTPTGYYMELGDNGLITYQRTIWSAGVVAQFTTAGTTWTGEAGGFDFAPRGASALRIQGSGNVGIGTVTPDGKIDLQAGSGGTAISISANYPESYRWRMIPTDRGNAIDLDFTVSDSSDAQERLLQLSHSTSGRPEFALLNNQLVVNNGNVGIGITPHYLAKLDVNGHSVIRHVLVVGWDPPPNLDPERFDRDYPGLKLGVKGNVYVVGGVKVNEVWVHSDDRIKFNEQKLEYGLDTVMALETWRYDRAEWEVDQETDEIIIHPEKTKSEIGLLAQEVQKVIPEAVSIPENENSQVWSLSYNTIIPVLVKAIQEQQAQIESLKQRIETLEQR